MKLTGPGVDSEFVTQVVEQLKRIRNCLLCLRYIGCEQPMRPCSVHGGIGVALGGSAAAFSESAVLRIVGGFGGCRVRGVFEWLWFGVVDAQADFGVLRR